MLDRQARHYRSGEGCSKHHPRWGEELLEAIHEKQGDVGAAVQSLHHTAYGLELRQPILRAPEYTMVIRELSKEHPTWAQAVATYAKAMLPGVMHQEIDRALRPVRGPSR